MLVVDIQNVTIIYLIPVLVATIRWGVAAAVVAAIAGIAASDFFFLPPIYDFRIHSPDQVVDIAVFILVALAAGHLAGNLRRARMREQAEMLRDALVGSISHELSTPLASILGSASILAESPAIVGDQRLASLVQIMQLGANRLNSEIQNLLDATRIANDGIRPHSEWVDPHDILNAVIGRKQAILAAERCNSTSPMIYL